MAKHRTKEEKLKRIRLGSRYVGLDLGQFYWECLKLAAVSEELTETDILRRIIRSWSETLPAPMQEQARAETSSVEVWKTEQLRARKGTKIRAKEAKVHKGQVKLRGKGPRKPLRTFLRHRERSSARN
jgi:hypothetical protein